MTEPSPAVAHLSARGVRIGYGPRVVVDALDLDVERGSVTTIIGPNGSGKSTILRGLAQLQRLSAGTVTIDGVPVASMPARTLARRLAVLPQSAQAPEGMTVGDLVARGRQPHQRWYRQWSELDEHAVLAALESMHVDDLATRPLDELSGGQRQRAWIAMCLAQEAPLMLLDEPTTHLDMAHAVDILSTVRRLTREQGRTVLMVLHDLSLAARCSDRLVVVHDGGIRASGAPADVLDPTLLADVFDLDARVYPDPVDGAPTIAPTSLVPHDRS